jgi:hypothetical protein
MTGTSSEHWFDRLATRHTRRQALKAALAGTALSLPLLRVDAADADTVHACQKGCLYTNHLNTDHTLNVTCFATGLATSNGYLFGGAVFGMASFAIPGGLYKEIEAYVVCAQQALLQQKANAFDCSQPNCPGFNPKGTNGGCAGCMPTDACCSDQSVDQGFQCCECCGPNGGCASGVTACGS